MKLKTVKGCRDLLEADILKFNYIIEKFKKLANLYSCSEISTPILEHSSVFSKSLGEASDIVSKEMYSFVDQGNDHLTLRPEFTAAVMRAVFSNNLLHNLPQKFFSYGPLFRRDNPQAGRQRQFHQLNVEFLGFDKPFSDAEAIKFGADILDVLGISDYSLEVNSLGCADSRAKYQKALFEYFNDNLAQLSEISKVRLNKNPLRILDSKEDCDKILVQNAPKVSDYYTHEASERFAQVLDNLDVLKVGYKVNERIVRGLDYYSHTAFEFTSNALGAQSAIIAGGRYDDLGAIIGGTPIPAVGFAGGVERLMLLTSESLKVPLRVIVIPISSNEHNAAVELVAKLRSEDICCSLEVGKKVGDVIQRAVAKIAPKYALLIGENELQQGLYTLKDLQNFKQESLSFEDLVHKIKKYDTA